MSRKIKDIIKDLEVSLRNRNNKNSHEFVEEGISLDQNLFFKEVKRRGFFRASNRDYNYSNLEKIVNKAVKNDKLNNTNKAYVESVQRVLEICKKVKPIYKMISKNASLFRTLQVYSESLFWEENILNENVCPPLSKEDVALALSSYYILLQSQNTKINLNTLNGLSVNQEIIANGKINNLVLKINLINKFREIEILVDRFGYSINEDFEINHPKINFEKSQSLGWIVSGVQNLSFFAQALENFYEGDASEVGWVKDCDDYWEKVFSKFVHKFEKPIPRITLGIPDFGTSAKRIMVLLKRRLLSTEWTKQETVELAFLCKELHINKDKIVNEVLDEHSKTTLKDIIYFQRIVRFCKYLFTKVFSDNDLWGSEYFHNSLIARTKIKEFENVISFFLGQDKVQFIFENLKFSFDGQAKEIQYNPLLQVGEICYVPLATISNSNICRNFLQTSRFRFDSDEYDPLGLAVNKVMLQLDIPHCLNIDFNSTGVSGEIDLVFQLNTTIYFVEFKNSLHPCSFFELRTTFDYLNKASLQLDKIKNILDDPINSQTIWDKIRAKNDKLNIDSATETKYFIINGNRMFMGLELNGYPIRPLYEFLNFLENKTHIIKSDQQKEYYFTSSGTKGLVNSQELGEYLSLDNSIYKYRFDSMDKEVTEINFKNKKVYKNRYMLNMEKFQKLSDQFLSV